MNKSTKGYLFEKDGSGKYILTHQTIIYPCKLRRIIGKRNVKGRKVDFEEIEIQDQSSARYRCLIKRKDLTVSDVLGLIVCYENGTRSIQSHPYTEDILDPSIIDELEMNQSKFDYDEEEFIDWGLNLSISNSKTI